MIWLLPTAATVYPDVVSTPTPTMLETTTYVAIRRPKPEDTGGSPGKLGALAAVLRWPSPSTGWSDRKKRIDGTSDPPIRWCPAYLARRMCERPICFIRRPIPQYAA